jgi:hypothetical protein
LLQICDGDFVAKKQFQVEMLKFTQPSRGSRSAAVNLRDQANQLMNLFSVAFTERPPDSSTCLLFQGFRNWWDQQAQRQ